MGAKDFLSGLYSRITEYVVREKPNFTREAALEGVNNKEAPEYCLSKLICAARKGEVYTNKQILLLMRADSKIYRGLPKGAFCGRSGKKLRIPQDLDEIIRNESFEIDADGKASKLKKPAYHFGVVYRDGTELFFLEYDRAKKPAGYKPKKQRPPKERKPLFGKIKEKGKKPAVKNPDKKKGMKKGMQKKPKEKDSGSITFDD